MHVVMLHNTFEVVKSYLRGSRSRVIGIVHIPRYFYTNYVFVEQIRPT